MWEVFSTTVPNNVGMSFELIITLIMLFGGAPFYAKDFKLGMLIHLLSFGLEFMWFYEAGLNYGIPLTLFFMFLVITSLSLYAVTKSGPQSVIA